MRFGLGRAYQRMEKVDKGQRMEREKSLQKTWRPKQDIFQQVSQQGFVVPRQMPNGVNSSLQCFSLLLSGTADGHLWTYNMSSYPADQRRLLSLNGANTFLVNFAQDTFPSRINIQLAQVNGSKNSSGIPAHIIGVLVPVGAATTVMNPGNIVGYNVSYGLLGQTLPTDITGIPSLTFDLSIDNQTQPIGYPLATPLALQLHLTHVTL